MGRPVAARGALVGRPRRPPTASAAARHRRRDRVAALLRGRRLVGGGPVRLNPSRLSVPSMYRCNSYGTEGIMSSLPSAVLAAIFVVAAAVIWIAGIQLSGQTDVLSERLHLGSALGGLILLAIATNLPEIAI